MLIQRKTMSDNNGAVNLKGCSLNITINTFKLENNNETKTGDDLTISSPNFIHYIRDEQFAVIGKPTIGISLPTAELKINIGIPQDAIRLLQADRTKVSVEIVQGDDNADTFTSNYIATNFDIEQQGNNSIVTIYLIADLGDFINKSIQKAYPADGKEQITSIKAIYEAMKDFAGVIDIETDTEAKENEIKETFDTDDKQVWLQFNTPTYQFIANVLKHCNPKNQDLILGAINHNKLKLVSYNSVISKDKKDIKTLIYANLPKDARGQFHEDNIVFTPASVKLESSMGVYDYMLGIETIPQVKILQNSTTMFDKITSLFKKQDTKKGKPPNEAFESGRIVATKFDCGNTHENYWNAQLANEKKLSKVYRNIVYVTIDDIVLDSKINILDTAFVNLMPRNMDGDSANATNAVLNGNFVVLGISRYISQSVISNRIALGRDTY